MGRKEEQEERAGYYSTGPLPQSRRGVSPRLNQKTMALDSAKAQGDAIVEMIQMQKEIYAHLGNNVNTWV
ncbi:MAG: YjfB family protein [Bacillota bacterium]